MNKNLLLLLNLFLLLIFGCSKDDNPVEPVENSSVNDIWYGGQNYSADSLNSWGMGSSEGEYIHNDRDYEWYIDQANTGYAS